MSHLSIEKERENQITKLTAAWKEKLIAEHAGMRSCQGIKNALNIKYPSLFSVYRIIRDGSLFITVGSLRTGRTQINKRCKE